MKMLSILFVLLSPFSRQLHAQHERVMNQPEGVRSILLYELVPLDIAVDTLKLLAQCDSSIAIAYELLDSTRLIEGYQGKASILRHLRRFDASVDHLDKAIPIAIRNKSNKLKTLYNEQGLNYYFLSNYSKALENHLRCLLLCESDRNDGERSSSLSNVGLIYYKLRNYEKAMEYFNGALSLKRESNDPSEMDLLLVNIGFCYAELEDFPTALKVIAEGLSMCGETCNENLQLMADFGLGMIFFKQDNLEKAMVYLNRSLVRSKAQKSNRFLTENLLCLARIYLKQRNYAAVNTALGEAEEMATKFNYKELLLDAYDQYSALYRLLHEYERAVSYQAKFTELRDRLYGEELLHKISALQVEFEARHEVETIRKQDELLILQETSLNQRRLVNLVIGVVAFMLLVILALLYYSYSSKKRLNQRLDELVQEKTLDLEKRHQHLYETNKKLRQFILTTVEQFNAPLATLRGICHVGKMEIQDPDIVKYFEKLEQATDEMTEIVTIKTKAF